MDALSETYVKHVKNHGDFLCVNIYGPDTQQLSAQLWLSRLFGYETFFTGGRFQHYRPSRQEFAVTVSHRFHDISLVYPGQWGPPTSWFTRCIDWIGEEIAEPWHFAVRATMEYADSEPDIAITFSFTDVDDAVLFKLKFG